MELVPSQGLPVAGTESWRCGKLSSAVHVFRKDRDVFFAPWPKELSFNVMKQKNIIKVQ